MTNVIHIERLFKNISSPYVLGAPKITSGRVIERVDELNFSLVGIVSPPNQKLTLKMYDSKEFAFFMAGEANRFFLASMISLNRAKSEENENISWQIVEHYYSAYYAVHYLIRVSGLSITNVDKATLRAISRTNITGDTSQSLESGLNLLSFDRLCENIIFEKKDKKGGSHIDAWAAWVLVIERLIEQANTDITEYAASAVSLYEHLSFIKRNNDNFSPTIIRNEINYQFANNAWCFDGLTKVKLRRVRAAIAGNDLTLIDRGDLLESLVCNNNFIISLAKLVFTSASERSAKSICRSLLNKYKNKIPTLN